MKPESNTKNKSKSKPKTNNKKQIQRRNRTPETLTVIETADIKAAEFLISIFHEPNKAVARKLIKKIDSTDDGIHTIIERIESGEFVI